MTASLREFVSEKLINSAAESALERQEMRRRLQAVAPQARGQQEALATLGIVELFESAMLWLGWRLQPRNIAWSDRHPV